MIGLFDSGVGGLTVLSEIRRLLPSTDVIYFGDTAHVPYGNRSAEEITGLAVDAMAILLRYRPDLIVVACNTATAIAIQTLRTQYPVVPIVGVVPVVKLLAKTTRNKRVAVCATALTLASSTYAQLKNDFAQGIDFLELAQPDWVMIVESGDITGSEAEQSVTTAAQKIRDFGADALALGSTHFPFLRPQLAKELPGVAIMDSGPAVARQVVRILSANKTLPPPGPAGQTTFLCSGDPGGFSWVLSQYLGTEIKAQSSRHRPTGTT